MVHFSHVVLDRLLELLVNVKELEFPFINGGFWPLQSFLHSIILKIIILDGFKRRLVLEIYMAWVAWISAFVTGSYRFNRRVVEL